MESKCQGGGTCTSIIIGRKVPQSYFGLLPSVHAINLCLLSHQYVRYWTDMSNTSTFCLKLYNGTDVVHNVYCTTSFFCPIEHWFESCIPLKINKCITVWISLKIRAHFISPMKYSSQLLLEDTLVEIASFSITGHDCSCFQYYLFQIPYTATNRELLRHYLRLEASNSTAHSDPCGFWIWIPQT